MSTGVIYTAPKTNGNNFNEGTTLTDETMPGVETTEHVVRQNLTPQSQTPTSFEGRNVIPMPVDEQPGAAEVGEPDSPEVSEQPGAAKEEMPLEDTYILTQSAPFRCYDIDDDDMRNYEIYRPGLWANFVETATDQPSAYGYLGLLIFSLLALALLYFGAPALAIACAMAALVATGLYLTGHIFGGTFFKTCFNIDDLH